MISEELIRAKWNYENYIEQNKIVQIQRNDYSWLYFVKLYVKKKTWERLIGQELGFWHLNEEISN